MVRRIWRHLDSSRQYSQAKLEQSRGFHSRALPVLGAVFTAAALILVLSQLGGGPALANGGPGVPAKPTGLKVDTQSGSLNVSVDWDDTSGATSYSVRWRQQGPGNSLNEGVEAQSSSASIIVADYGKWVVRVEACNDSGCSAGNSRGFTVKQAPAATPESTETPPPAAAIPAKPTGVSVATQSGSLNVSVDWDDTSGATSYSVRWRQQGSGNSLNEGVKAQSSSASITVADYGNWVVRVEACNDSGCSAGNSRVFQVKQAPASTATPVSTATPPPAISVPGRPTALDASTEPGSLDVTVDWDDVEGAASYTVRWRQKSPGNTLNEGITVTSSTATISVTNFGKWSVRVKACNSAGCGLAKAQAFEVEPSDSDSIVITPPVPRKPSALASEQTTRGKVKLSWTAPEDDGGYAITGYKIVRTYYDKSTTKTSAVVLAEDTGSTSTSYVDSTIEGKTSYTYYVSAINSEGVGPAARKHVHTNPKEPIPLVPRDLESSETTRGEVTLTWNAPVDDGGFDITGYNILRTYYDKSTTNTSVVVLAEDTGSTSTSYVDSTVEELTSYTYWVAAINSEGVGVHAHENVRTKPQGSVPLAPQDLEAFEDIRGEVKLTWTAPEDDGGFDITGYKIVRTYYDKSTTKTSVVVLAEDTGSTSTSYVDNTVEEETAYTYYVSAINSEGVGTSVRDYIFTHPQRPIPLGPQNLESSETTRGEVTLSWTVPRDDGGFDITGYNILRTYYDQSLRETVVVVLAEDTESTSTSYVDNTVEALTSYTYWVAAINSEGVGVHTRTHVNTKPQESVPLPPGDLGSDD